jgi:hypothetical protein
MVIPRKRWLIRVENDIDEEEFDQFDEIPPFVTLMIKPRIQLANEAPYLRNDSVKYAQCVKIWPFVWRFDFHWILVWDMLNVWKYGHLCEKLTFTGYLCEICSMCENMAIWCLGSVSDVCAVSEALCSVSDRHYTESTNVFSFWWTLYWICQCVQFLMCVQFLKPCVQFLIDTILNLPMRSVSDGHYTKSANVFSFWWRKRETHTNKVCLSSEERETCTNMVCLTF